MIGGIIVVQVILVQVNRMKLIALYFRFLMQTLIFLFSVIIFVNHILTILYYQY